MRETLKQVLVAPMDAAEAGRRVQYAVKGSLMHRTLMGIIAARTVFQPELDAADATNALLAAGNKDLWEMVATERRVGRKWRLAFFVMSGVAAALAAVNLYMHYGT